ncbi:MAG: hypothetical protein B6241_04130 [Spirochaetaceae bacterium 4572_59]|nr:MAG: hypothetical protein B6241_04130 [Spirochaetaceae bacterium 4572_59]
MISIKNLNFSYDKKKVLNKLDLNLKKGNIYGLLGRNGAGKTTLLKLISGELFQQKGSMQVMSHNPANRTPSFLSDIFYIPEEFSLPAMTIQHYVKLTSPFYPGFNEIRFEKNLREFELSRKGEKLSKMSYGQKKKFLLAFGLAAGTSLLLLDEPTNGLDIPSKTQFRRTVASALGENQIFLISTHQVRDMENLIDPLIIINDGEICLNASLEQISQEYVMEQIPKGDIPPEALYCESVPGAQIIIRRRLPGDEESAMDMEILFNFIISTRGLNR